MQTYIVEFDYNDSFEIEAPNLETAWELCNEHYPEVWIDCIYPKASAYNVED